MGAFFQKLDHFGTPSVPACKRCPEPLPEWLLKIHLSYEGRDYMTRATFQDLNGVEVVEVHPQMLFNFIPVTCLTSGSPIRATAGDWPALIDAKPKHPTSDTRFETFRTAFGNCNCKPLKEKRLKHLNVIIALWAWLHTLLSGGTPGPFSGILTCISIFLCPGVKLSAKHFSFLVLRTKCPQMTFEFFFPKRPLSSKLRPSLHLSSEAEADNHTARPSCPQWTGWPSTEVKILEFLSFGIWPRVAASS